MIEFADLLAKAAAGGARSQAELQAEQVQLQGEVVRLEEQLVAGKARLRGLEQQLLLPVRQAVKAAVVLGIPVPPEYQKYQPAAAPVSPPGEPRTRAGGYRWVALGEEGARGQPLPPRVLGLARGLWSFSKGSGGTAGKQGQGVLTVGEFQQLLQVQHGKVELGPRETVTVRFPNGRRVQLTRLEAEK